MYIQSIGIRQGLLPGRCQHVGTARDRHAPASWQLPQQIIDGYNISTARICEPGRISARPHRGESNMRYKLLGKSGLRVSELCLGTMTFGEDWGWGASKEESRKVYDAFLEAGGNFIDTANVYTNGTSEKLLGEFMADHRDRIVLATKYTNAAPGNDPNAAGNHRKSMMQAVEASLKRLRTEYI